MKLRLCSAAMFAAMAVSAGTFDAAVWRGETAYVEIPETLRGKVSCLSERWTGDDIKLTLLRFDEVKYDRVEKYTDDKGKTKARIAGKGRVRDVCREWKKGDKDLPSMIKIAALAAKYGYKGACANNIDFSVFRREVEALVNATAATEGN